MRFLALATLLALTSCQRPDPPAPVGASSAPLLVFAQDQKLTPGATGEGDGAFTRGVAVAGDTAVIGAPSEKTGGVRTGAAYVYVYANGAWALQQRLAPADGAVDDHFGHAVAIEGDSVIIGAPGATVASHAAQGAAYVFVRTGTTWSQQAKLTAADGVAGDTLGTSVAFSGDTALVGAPNRTVASAANRGAAYVFLRSGVSFSPQPTLTASDGAAHDAFGSSVALSGGTAIVGAPGATIAAHAAQGAAYLYSGASFATEQKLSASDGAADDAFGTSVALAGTTALVGAPAAMVGGHAGQGAAYAYDGVGFAQEHKLAAADGAVNDAFGSAVGLGSARAVVGAPRAMVAGKAQAGAVYLLGGGSFATQSKLSATGGGTFDALGTSVAASGDRVLAGAISASGVHAREGAGYLFALKSTSGDACSKDGDCANGHCVDGVCCDTACGGGKDGDCQACSLAKGASADGICTILPASITCRGAAGACDEPETCDGFNYACPVDLKRGSSVECRAAAGDCDVAEACDGASDGCPADVKLGSDVICRAAAGACDVADACDGTSAACPADIKQPMGTACRAATGDCDVGEACDGTSGDCPADQTVADGTLCAGGLCQAGLCIAPDAGSTPATPPDVDGGSSETGAAAGNDCSFAGGAAAPGSWPFLIAIAVAMRAIRRRARED